MAERGRSANVAKLERKLYQLEERLAGLEQVVEIEGSKVTIRASEILIEADSEIAVRAATTVDIEGSASLDVRSGGVLRITGSLVQIN